MQRFTKHAGNSSLSCRSERKEGFKVWAASAYGVCVFIIVLQYICEHIFLCLLIFYALFYMVCSVCTGAMRIETFDWKIPFDHKKEPSLSNVDYLVSVMSLEITFILSGLLFVPLVGSLVWDYAITVTTLHVCICCIVIMEFPLMWEWWLEIGCGMLLMLVCGQTLAHLTFRGTSHKHSDF